jgi:hypothetical protein
MCGGGGIGRRAVLAGAGLAAAGGCAAWTRDPAGAAATPPPPGTVPVWLVSLGWHTEILLPVAPQEGPLGRLLAPWFPRPGPLAFGFGERGYFTHPAPGLAESMGAMTPGEATLLVAPMPSPAEDDADGAVLLPVAPPVRDRLAALLAEEFSRDAEGRPLPSVPTLARPGGWFFETGRIYSLAYTCNTWATHRLAEAGLPLRWEGIVLASGAMAEARRARRRLLTTGASPAA